jgi:biopolymer transport protein TolR
MKHLLELCMVAALLAASLPSLHAQTPQKGISVELPVTHNAVPVPDADNEDSLIVSITSDGSLYFGIDPVHVPELAQKIRERLANRPNSTFYIKADARTAYTPVVQVLLAVRRAGVDSPVFLTAQTDSSEPGALVPPKGLKVLTVPSSPESPVVRLIDSGLQSAVLVVSGERVPWTALLSTLRQRIQDKRRNEVQVQADGTLPFSQVMHGIDVCRSAGASVVMIAPAL